MARDCIADMRSSTRRLIVKVDKACQQVLIYMLCYIFNQPYTTYDDRLTPCNLPPCHTESRIAFLADRFGLTVHEKGISSTSAILTE